MLVMALKGSMVRGVGMNGEPNLDFPDQIFAASARSGACDRHRDALLVLLRRGAGLGQVCGWWSRGRFSDIRSVTDQAYVALP